MLRKKLKLDPLVNSTKKESEERECNSANDKTDIIAQTDGKATIYLNNIDNNILGSIASKILAIEADLCRALQKLTFSTPIAYIYNPLEYASEPHIEYIKRFCNSSKPVFFLGINPGPFGMCQTGVPFGEVKAVQNFLGIEKAVYKPNKECPARPILGFECKRSEISGLRFWGYFQQLCKTSDNFFKNSFVYNYCPLAFMKNNGANVTPAEIKGSTQKKIEEICDESLLKILQLLEVKEIVGIGKFAEKRAWLVLQQSDIKGTSVYFMPHPSPRAVNNQNWPEKAETFLKDNNLMKYFVE